MVEHVVQQGECLSSIAARYGMKSWRDLYDHPDNAELKTLGRHPNVLAPGDRVMVPEAPRKWVARKTEKKHRFVVPAPLASLRVVVRDWQGEGLANRRFAVTIGDEVLEGQTDARGLLEVPISPLAPSARLRVWTRDESEDPDPTIDRVLALGHLDPVESISGVQARLSNLGYACAATGDMDDATLAAASAFRVARGLPEVEEDPSSDDPESEDDAVERTLDAAFRDALTKAHEGS